MAFIYDYERLTPFQIKTAYTNEINEYRRKEKALKQVIDSFEDNSYIDKAKLNALKEAVEGKRIIMIDDSIVRGTTSDRIVRMLREAGAKEVYAFSEPSFHGDGIRYHVIDYPAGNETKKSRMRCSKSKRCLLKQLFPQRDR